MAWMANSSKCHRQKWLSGSPYVASSGGSLVRFRRPRGRLGRLDLVFKRVASVVGRTMIQVHSVVEHYVYIVHNDVHDELRCQRILLYRHDTVIKIQPSSQAILRMKICGHSFPPIQRGLIPSFWSRPGARCQLTSLLRFNCSVQGR